MNRHWQNEELNYVLNEDKYQSNKPIKWLQTLHIDLIRKREMVQIQTRQQNQKHDSKLTLNECV